MGTSPGQSRSGALTDRKIIGLPLQQSLTGERWAGVQSTTVLLLACEGVIPRFHMALFADTGWEPQAVHANLERLRSTP